MKAICAFRDERNLKQFHRARNLAAVAIESGELQELMLVDKRLKLTGDLDSLPCRDPCNNYLTAAIMPQAPFGLYAVVRKPSLSSF